MKRLLPLISLALGVFLGIWAKQQHDLPNGNTNNPLAHASTELAVAELEPRAVSTEPPPSNWTELLSGLPEDDYGWDFLLPLDERIERFQTFDQIAALFGSHPKQLPPTERDAFFGYSEAVIPLLAHRAAEIDPQAACEFQFDDQLLFLLAGVYALERTNPEQLIPTLRPIVPKLSEDDVRDLLPILMEHEPDFGLTLIETEEQRGEAYYAWAKHDPTAAAAKSLTLPKKEREQIMASVMYSWGKSAPKAALAWAGALEDPIERQTMIKAIHETMPYGNAEEALRILSSSDDAKAIQQCARTFARRDMDKAMASIFAIEDTTSRQSAMLGLFQAATEKGDLDTMLKVQRDLPPGSHSSYQIHGAIDDLKRHDPSLVIEWLKKTDAREFFHRAKHRVLETWIASDVRAAKAYLTEHPELLTEYETVGALAGSLSKLAPDEATRWAQTLGNDRMRSHAMRHAMNSWLHSDFESASAYASSLSDPDERKRYLDRAADHLVQQQKDQKGIQQWLAGLSPGDREIHTARVASRTENLQESFELLTPLLDTDEPSSTVIRTTASVVERWSDLEPAEAAAWLAEQPHEGLRKAAMDGIVERWFRQSPEDATAFVDRLDPDAPEYDQALAGMSDYLGDYDPREGIARATQISDPELRDRHLRRAIVNLAKIDLPAAEEQIRTTELSDKELQNALYNIKSATGVQLEFP